MSILLKTHKMLWGRSGNCCAFPDCRKQLVMDISETDDISIVGEEAHIVAREEDGPRGKSDLTPEQRDKFDNLILMCSIHHKVIDDHPDNYPVEKLKAYKLIHEKWVEQNLQQDHSKQKEDEIYASYIDKIIELATVDNWKGWTSYIFAGGEARMYKRDYDKLRELMRFLLSRVWFQRYEELKDSIKNFQVVLNDFLKIFDEFAEPARNEKELWTKKFYKIDRYDPEAYHELLEKYKFHIRFVEDLVLELTRALNYVFDMVRKYLISSFRIDEGVLIVEAGPFMDFSWRQYRTEYRGSERNENPYPGYKKFMEVRTSRDHCFGEGISDLYSHPFMNG